MAKAELSNEELDKAVNWFFEHAEEYGVKITPSEDGKAHFFVNGEEVDGMPMPFMYELLQEA